MRSDDEQEYRPVRSMLRRLIKAPTVFAILWPTLLVVGGYVGWHRWGSEHVTAQYYGIDPAKISVTEQPVHVRADIVKAVYRDTAMDGLSLLDRQATAKIASAFSMHPWVRSVMGVRKLPGGAIDVRLDYRYPVAMVLVMSPNPSDERDYFVPVDGDGVLLPSHDFSQAETRKFIYIEVPRAFTTKDYGTQFGDSRVEYAAQLAEILMPYREEVGIRSIGLFGDPRMTELPQYEVIKQDGTKFSWGSPPGAELPGERAASMKLRALIDGTTDGSTDLRMATPKQPASPNF